MQITISNNQLAVRKESDYLVVSCFNGWEDVQKLTPKVLLMDGQAYTFTGWNSDRNECYFKTGGMIATIKSK